jgi:hypothetical protein
VDLGETRGGGEVGKPEPAFVPKPTQRLGERPERRIDVRGMRRRARLGSLLG